MVESTKSPQCADAAASTDQLLNVVDNEPKELVETDQIEVKNEVKPALNVNVNELNQERESKCADAVKPNGESLLDTVQETAKPMNNRQSNQHKESNQKGNLDRNNDAEKRNTSDPKPALKQFLHGSVKEIAPCEIVKSEKCIGSGTFGSCYLAKYRGILVVVKEFRIRENDDENKVKEDVVYEAAVLSRLGDHPSLPLLFGVTTTRQPYRLITQFHGEKDKSLMLCKAIDKLSLKSIDWLKIMRQITEALKHIHTMGFLHNDLKSNNVVLEVRGDRQYNAVIIDFGKARRRGSPKPLKKLTSSQIKCYRKKYPHIAPEIPQGKGLQRADQYWDIVEEEIINGPGATASKSKIGYLLSGPFPNNNSDYGKPNHSKAIEFATAC
ncbi:putative serine/threonine-protein kinase [Exaiptasia diaphana]|nr:putative serine/threonine-protein kinase [Exaiptasia diaphana]